MAKIGRVVIIIQARMGSTRLPGKVLMTVLDKPLLGYLIERLSRAKLVDEIVIATTENSLDDVIEKFCINSKISCYRGSEDNVLSRYYDASIRFKANYVVRICSDSPLVDPIILDRMIQSFFNNECDYYGIDYSSTLINKNIKLFNSKVYNCSANETPFKDNFFDYCFCNSVFEYFTSKEYALEVIKEMKRVTKKGIYIINIRKKTHDCKKEKHKFNGVYKHLIYNTDDFFDFEISVSNYEQNERFNAIKYIT